MFAQFARWFSPSSDLQQAHAIYIALVGQARQPFFYEKMEVPDTLDGRFDMIVLHLSLLIERFKAEESEYYTALSGRVMEVFVSDMDRNLREMGIGDTGVKKRIKKMAAALNGRLLAYADALQDNVALCAALKRNIYGTTHEVADATVAELATYVSRAHASLAGQSAEHLAAATLRWGTE